MRQLSGYKPLFRQLGTSEFCIPSRSLVRFSERHVMRFGPITSTYFTMRYNKCCWMIRLGNMIAVAFQSVIYVCYFCWRMGSVFSAVSVSVCLSLFVCLSVRLSARFLKKVMNAFWIQKVRVSSLLVTIWWLFPYFATVFQFRNAFSTGWQ